jgi:hypothetical protein
LFVVSFTQTIYSKRAFKLNVAQIKTLCDFFNVDRSPDTGKSLDKETLIDRLLDFLGEPDPKMLNEEKKKKKSTPKKKAPKKKPSSKTKKQEKKKVVEDEEEDEEDAFDLVREHKKGDKPSDDAIRQWVRAYVVCFDMDSATTKHALKTASDKFGLDLAKEKDRIKELLAEEM